MKLGKIAVVATVVAAGLIAPTPARAADPPKIPTAIGYGGAVSTVDPTATAVGVEVLRRGGNAVDAAVAVAATLGVTEPFSAGIGGGGFFVYYDARTKRVHTIDGRESAPASMREDAFVNPATGAALRVPRGAGQRHLGRRARHAADLEAGAAQVGHPLAGPVAGPGRGRRRARVHGRRDVPSAGRRQRGRRSPSSRRPATSTCPAARRRRSAARCATPTSPTPTARSRAGAPTCSTRARSPATSSTPCRTRRWPKTRCCRGPRRSAPAR